MIPEQCLTRRSTGLFETIIIRSFNSRAEQTAQQHDRREDVFHWGLSMSQRLIPISTTEIANAFLDLNQGRYA